MFFTIHSALYSQCHFTIIIPSSRNKSCSLITPSNHVTVLSLQDFDPGSQPPSPPLSLWWFWESLNIMCFSTQHTGLSLIDKCQGSFSLMSPTMKRALTFNYKNNNSSNYKNLVSQTVANISIYFPSLPSVPAQNLFQPWMASILASGPIALTFLTMALLNGEKLTQSLQAIRIWLGTVIVVKRHLNTWTEISGKVRSRISIWKPNNVYLSKLWRNKH